MAIAALGLVLGIAHPARADAPVATDSPHPATAPATAPSATGPFSSDSPRGAIKAINDQLPAGGIKVARSIYLAKTADEKALANVMAQGDMTISKLESAVKDKFGADTVVAIDRILQAINERDLLDATETVTGDQAVITFQSNLQPITMQKVEGKWMVVVAAYLQAGEKAADVTQTQRQIIQLLDEVNQNLAAGSYPNFYLLERAVKQRMFRIFGEEGVSDDGAP